MAINKKLIHFETFENFNSQKLSANKENTKYTLGIDGEIFNGTPDILYQSIVWIKDAQIQWTHGQLYDGKTLIFDIIYPIGAIYLSTNNVNPSQLFGGEWEQIKDTFLLAAGSTYSAGSTGGEANHKLTYAELPKTEGDIVMHGATTGTQIAAVGGCFTPAVKVNNRYLGRPDLTTAGASSVYKIHYSNGGNDESHNNMPPYLTVYMWKRIS